MLIYAREKLAFVTAVCGNNHVGMLKISQDLMIFDSFPSFVTAVYGNKRVGMLRIRQVRVPSKNCNSFYLDRLLGEKSISLHFRMKKRALDSSTNTCTC